MGGSLVGSWTGFELCVWLGLIDLTLLVRGIQSIIERVGLNNSVQGVTERNSLNWLFGVSCIVFGLLSCVWGGSDSISGELIGVRCSV